MAAPAPTISFEIRYKAPRSCVTRLFIVGSPVELGAFNLSKRKFFQSFEASTRAKFKKWQRAMDGAPCSDDDNSSSASGSRSEKSSTTRLRKRGIEQESKRDQVLTFLEESVVILEEDPNDEAVEDLWATPNPVKFTSLKPGEKFSYAYFVWNCDENRVWEFEKFHEARLCQIPAPTASNPSNEWVLRAKAFGNRHFEMKAAHSYDNDSSDLYDDDYSMPANTIQTRSKYEDFDDDYDEDDIF